MTSIETFIDNSSNPLNEQQRQTLITLSRVQLKGKDYPVTPNAPLEDYLQTLRDMHPRKFHRTRDDLEARVFVDAPTTLIPHARAVRPRTQSPYLRDAK